MAEESTVPVRLEVFLAQIRPANLKIENWLTFFALLRAKEKPGPGTTRPLVNRRRARVTSEVLCSNMSYLT